MTSVSTVNEAIALDDPNPIEALRLYLVDSPCPYLGEIYRQIKAEWDATQTA